MIVCGTSELRSRWSHPGAQCSRAGVLTRTPAAPLQMVEDSMRWVAAPVGAQVPILDVVPDGRALRKVPQGYQRRGGEKVVDGDDAGLASQVAVLSHRHPS